MNHSVDVANAEILPRGDYEKVLRQVVADGHCPFCSEQLPKIHPKPLLWSSDHWTVTTNAWPYEGTRFHFLLIAAQHVERIEDLTPEARLNFFQQFDRLSLEYDCEGASILWRTGATELTGASVRHLHAQVVVGYPRSEGAKTITGLLGFGPRKDNGPSS